MKYLITSVLSCFILSVSIAQVHFSEVIRGEVFFGPNNVYPLHQEVCTSYVNLYEGIKSKMEAELNKGGNRDKLSVDIMELELLVQAWKRTIHNLNGLTLSDDACYAAEMMEEVFSPLDVSSYYPDTELEVYEFIHPRDTKLSKLKWVKKKANNCYSENPDDCFVWCSLLTEDHYEDNSKDFVTLDNYTNLNGFIIAPGSDRLIRSYSMKIINQDTPIYEVVYEDEKEKLHFPIISISTYACD